MAYKPLYNGILFSGLPGAGKTTTSRQLAELLGWQVFYIGGLWREQWTAAHPNKKISFENYMRAITLVKDKEMDGRGHEMLSRGKIVGDMWHGIIGEGLPILRVFVTAPLQIRAERAVATGKYTGKTIEEIKTLLNEREERQFSVAKKIYGDRYDFRAPSGYHITLNSGLLSVDEKISSVLHFFEKE